MGHSGMVLLVEFVRVWTLQQEIAIVNQCQPRGAKKCELTMGCMSPCSFKEVGRCQSGIRHCKGWILSAWSVRPLHLLSQSLEIYQACTEALCLFGQECL